MNSIPALLVSAAVAVLVLSAYAQIIPGEYVVELTGACPSACRAELRRALRAAGLQSCKVTDRVATIKTKSWGFISCTDKGRRAGEVSNGLRAEANNRLASVIRVDEDMEVRKIVRNRPNRPCRGRRCNT